MGRHPHCYVLLLSFTVIIAKELELPLCPSNVQFFPQNLPMHCRMPSNADFPMMPGGSQYPTMPPFQPPYYQSPSPDKQLNPIPVPISPGIPGPIPMPMPMMPMPGHGHKLPVIVMPFYSPDPSFKKPQNQIRFPKKEKKRRLHKRRPIYSSDTDTDTSSDTDRYIDRETDTDTSFDTSSDTSRDTSADRGWWKGWKRGWRRNARRLNRKQKPKKRKYQADLLTPVLQYVTKDGYVIFEKKISKGEAKDWLSVNKNGDTKTVVEKEIEDLNKSEQFDPNDDTDIVVKRKSKEDDRKELTTTTARTPTRKHRHHKPNLLLEKNKMAKRKQ